MSILSDLVNQLQHKKELQGGSGSKTYPAQSLNQIQAANSQIEADGARMYEQAHPGKTYQTNQNHEFQAGALPQGFDAHKAANYTAYDLPHVANPFSNLPARPTQQNTVVNAPQIKFRTNPLDQLAGNPGVQAKRLQMSRSIMQPGVQYVSPLVQQPRNLGSVVFGRDEQLL